MTAPAQISISDIEEHPDLLAMPNDPVLVEEYADDMNDGDEFPPIVIFRDAERKNWIGDGYKRVQAMKKIERGTAWAIIHDGTQRDAFLFGVQANLKHGRRASLEDKVRCATLLLQDKEWSGWSDTVIAKKCGLGRTKVNGIRKEVAIDASTVRASYRNGKMLETDTANIGRQESTDEKRIARMVKHIQKAIGIGDRVDGILAEVESLRLVVSNLEARV